MINELLITGASQVLTLRGPARARVGAEMRDLAIVKNTPRSTFLCVPLRPLRLVSHESRKTAEDAEDAEERRESLSEEHEIVCCDSAVKHFSRPI